MKLLSSEKLRDLLGAKMKSKGLSYRQSAKQMGLSFGTVAKVMRPDKAEYGISMRVWNIVQAWKPRAK